MVPSINTPCTFWYNTHTTVALFLFPTSEIIDFTPPFFSLKKNKQQFEYRTEVVETVNLCLLANFSFHLTFQLYHDYDNPRSPFPSTSIHYTYQLPTF